MFQYSRLDVMFNRIRINEYTSVNDLESLLGITDRTIRNDIQEINNDLEKNGAIIKLKRNHGYYISILDEDKYNKFVKEMDTEEDNASLLDSSEDRIKSILYSLLSTNRLHFIRRLYPSSKKVVYLSFFLHALSTSDDSFSIFL